MNSILAKVAMKRFCFLNYCFLTFIYPKFALLKNKQKPKRSKFENDDDDNDVDDKQESKRSKKHESSKDVTTTTNVTLCVCVFSHLCFEISRLTLPKHCLYLDVLVALGIHLHFLFSQHILLQYIISIVCVLLKKQRKVKLWAYVKIITI